MARKRYKKGKKVVPNLQRSPTGRIAMGLGDAIKKKLEPKYSEDPDQARKDEQARQEAEKQEEKKYAPNVRAGTPEPTYSTERDQARKDEAERRRKEGSSSGSGLMSGGSSSIRRPPTTVERLEESKPKKSEEQKRREIRDNPETESPFTKTKAADASSPAQREREFRAEDSARRMERLATGETTLEDIGAKGTASKIVEQSDEIIDREDARFKVAETGEALDSEDYKVDTSTQALKEKVDTITDEELGQAADATEVEASTFTAAQTDEDVTISAAQGVLSEESKIAEDLGIDRVDKIQEAQVQVREGSLAERVVGNISDASLATAAKVQGIDVRRVTRAKGQLSRAGMSPDDIALLGNDPEKLEEALMGYSEKERGIIAGLPVEALVSTQMDTLFEGMKDGEIPLWAKPATDKIEAILAQRGLSASSVGRDALTGTLINEAFKIAQSNATAIQASVTQEKSIEAQALLREAEFNQQTALTNAQTVFKMDMAQFNADQQRELSNSKFLQTVSLTDASMEQQAVIQDALLESQANIAEADMQGKLRIANAKQFLAMDMTNLSNRQQAVVLESQQEQQRMLTNTAAENASRQFNAASENQTNQFMASLKDGISKFNATQKNAAEQFNTAQTNAAEARLIQRQADADKFNVQLAASIDQYNEQNQFAREQFNVQNALVIDQSNAQWRREINKIDTAAQNAMNARNAQNQFAMTQSANSQLWQELRDEFDYIWKSSENAANRETNIVVAGINGEHSGLKNSDAMNKLKNLLALYGD